MDRGVYEITVADAPPTPVVVAMGSPPSPDALPDTILRLSRAAYAALDGVDVGPLGCNVVLYEDGVPDIQVGVAVGFTAAFVPIAVAVADDGPPVGASVLPAGVGCWTLHVGPYHELGPAHGAVRRWCAANGHELAGPHWEIYRDWNDDPAKLETEVWYLLRS
jgi:hypothetical protein